ncbi:4-hydroxy-tetrahydrodipicolinate reductase [bacterium]|nr:4-hydroxy-tetrahydrodipicolinate reductase [bacterium]
MSIIRLLVPGACGRMGLEVLSAAVSSDDFEIVGASEKPDHDMIGSPLSDATGIPGLAHTPLLADLSSAITDADVIVDFTTPGASLEHFRLACTHGKAIVIGTTGFSASQIDEIMSRRDEARCVLSPNMSRGMNVFFVLAELLGAVFSDYDVEIAESHHRGKKDSPSGSALRLARSLAQSRCVELGDVAVYGRHGGDISRSMGEIGIHSIRAGEIVGEHSLLFAGQGERMEIVHNVERRGTFAAGALLAARFIVDAERGVYSMNDVLGLSSLLDSVRKLAR